MLDRHLRIVPLVRNPGSSAERTNVVPITTDPIVKARALLEAGADDFKLELARVRAIAATSKIRRLQP
jgi:hypothetical protein